MGLFTPPTPSNPPPPILGDAETKLPAAMRMVLAPLDMIGSMTGLTQKSQAGVPAAPAMGNIGPGGPGRVR
jgi:hypothetical protein